MNVAKKSASAFNAQILVLVSVTVALVALLVQLGEIAGGNNNSRLLANELRPTFRSAREYSLLSLAGTIEKLASDRIALQGALSGLHEEMDNELAVLTVKMYKEEVVAMDFVSSTERTIACNNIEQLRTAGGSILTEYPKGLPEQAETDYGKGQGVLKVHYWTCRVK